MSWVTNILLHTGLSDEVLLPEVNAFFEEGIRGFVSLDDPALPKAWYGGTKFLEVALAVGAFNHINLSALLSHLRAINWSQPESLQLLICDQEDFRFQVLDVFPDAQARYAQDDS